MPRLHPHATFTNNIFKESTATYLGVGSPAFRNMVGFFINNGNDTVEMKDIYGNDITYTLLIAAQVEVGTTGHIK